MTLCKGSFVASWEVSKFGFQVVCLFVVPFPTCLIASHVPCVGKIAVGLQHICMHSIGVELVKNRQRLVVVPDRRTILAQCFEGRTRYGDSYLCFEQTRMRLVSLRGRAASGNRPPHRKHSPSYCNSRRCPDAPRQDRVRAGSSAPPHDIRWPCGTRKGHYKHCPGCCNSWRCPDGCSQGKRLVELLALP